jgi:hypothetical protein
MVVFKLSTKKKKKPIFKELLIRPLKVTTLPIALLCQSTGLIELLSELVEKYRESIEV